MSTILGEVREVVEDRFAGFGDKMRTGYADVDVMLGELVPGTVTLVAGPPAVGKSTFVLGAAVHIARKDGPVLLVTGDSSSATGFRYLGAHSGVGGVRLREGGLRDRDWRAVAQVVDRTVSLPLRILDDPMTVEEMVDLIGAARDSDPSVRLVVIDPLDRCVDEGSRLGDIVAKLRDAARAAHVAVIATTALVGQVQGQDERVVDEVDTIGVLTREGDSRMQLVPIVVSITKNRHGPTGTVRLLLDRRRPRIVNATPPGYDDSAGDEIGGDVDDSATSASDGQPSPAESISVPRYQLDRFSSMSTVVRLAFIDVVAAGTLPFVSTAEVDSSVDALTLLPPGAVTERSARHESGAVLLTRCGDELILVESSSTGASVHVAASTPARGDEVVAEIRRRLPPPAAGMVMLRTWHHDRNCGSQWIERPIEAPQWADIADNYPPSTRTSLDVLNRLTQPTGGGRLVLWHGIPGTGKTTAVRALIRSWVPWCSAHYIADPERFFGNSSYMSEVVSAPARTLKTRQASPTGRGPWRLVIAEDSDEYLRATARRDAGADLGRLLNLTDGILGQGTNVLVLLTTNEELSRLHPAVTRPGRCLAAVKFDAFEPDAASNWLGTPIDQPTTLAELLQRRGDLSAVTGHTSTNTTTGQYL
jgi:hypothetical protein